MSKKEKCKALMSKFFGPATANMVDSMTEDEVVEKCKTKVASFLGPEKAMLFDNI
ncbi:hypothetical protein JXB31_00605 [Candidatus Woesearchaeota archaeon]|nr:hypothetical protein [Candidatus Woesearchaeota archaeon]